MGEVIVAAACKETETGVVYVGARHFDEVMHKQLKAANVPTSALSSLFAVGDRVMHRKFGEGDVTEIRGNGNDARVVISFAAYGQKEFALNIAPIVKVNQ
ncbi:MAG: hypothetical protein LLF96_02965 [Eubacteriales bacterium]|nr:hypothetical protein [Eubacteriales bacterium]